jgi:hypothetical protein
VGFEGGSRGVKGQTTPSASPIARNLEPSPNWVVKMKRNFKWMRSWRLYLEWIRLLKNSLTFKNILSSLCGVFKYLKMRLFFFNESDRKLWDQHEMLPGTYCNVLKMVEMRKDFTLCPDWIHLIQETLTYVKYMEPIDSCCYFFLLALIAQDKFL